jgi:hypothetical protein
MATPSYSTFQVSPFVDVLGGAQTAIAGIAAEVRSAAKAKAQLNSFADTLEREGLVGDAAIYRQQAEADKPNFTQAAITGKAAERDYEMPFKQALTILSNKQDNDAAAERARASRSAGIGVDARQGLRLQDSILSSDLDIAKTDYTSAEREIADATNDANSASAAGNPDLVEVNKRRIEIAKQKQADALARMKATNSQRKAGVAALTNPGNGGFDMTVPGGIEAPDLPVPSVTEQTGPEISLLPDSERNGKPVYNSEGTTGPDSPVAIAGSTASKNLRIARNNAVKEFGSLEAIVTAPNQKALDDIVANERKMRESVPFKSQKEAEDAGNAVLPKGWTLEVLPKGSGYTYKLNDPSSAGSASSKIILARADKVFYVGEGGVVYERGLNEPESSGRPVKRKDGSGFTVAEFLQANDSIGKARAAGIPVNPPATIQNPTVKQAAQLPTYLLGPNVNQQEQQTTPARNMWNRLQNK